MITAFVLRSDEDKKIIVDEKTGKLYTLTRTYCDSSGEYYLVVNEVEVTECKTWDLDYTV